MPTMQQIIHNKVMDDVTKERIKQIEEKGYDLRHDHWHRPQEMIALANREFTSPATMEGRAEWYSRETFIKAIAILVAAVEAMDDREQGTAYNG